MDLSNSIISIDLDIIMSPFCAIYTDNIIDMDDRQFTWDKISENFNVYDFLPDIDIINKVKTILQVYSGLVDKVYIGYNHSSILNAIDDNKDKFNSYKFDLYNIDFHHDMCYSDTEKMRIINQGLPSCGSWVGFLQYNNYLNSYTWYCGLGSAIHKSQIDRNECFNKSIKILRFDQNDFPMNLKPKILYVATSLPWIPPHLNIVIDDILHVIPDEKKIVLDGAYSLNYDRKQFLNMTGK